MTSDKQKLHLFLIILTLQGWNQQIFIYTKSHLYCKPDCGVTDWSDLKTVNDRHTEKQKLMCQREWLSEQQGVCVIYEGSSCSGDLWPTVNQTDWTREAPAFYSGSYLSKSFDLSQICPTLGKIPSNKYTENLWQRGCFFFLHGRTTSWLSSSSIHLTWCDLVIFFNQLIVWSIKRSQHSGKIIIPEHTVNENNHDVWK